MKLSVEFVVDDVSDAQRALTELAVGLSGMDMTSLQNWSAFGPVVVRVPNPEDRAHPIERRVGSFKLERTY